MSRLIPRGAVVAGLGKRFAAAVLDFLPLAAIYGLVYLALRLSSTPTIVLAATISGSVLGAAYGLYQWWAYANRGAGLGARAMGLRLVSLKDGEPIGWWRVFLRQLVFSALMGTIVGGIALLVFLVIHERRQGWHDMVGGAVVVQPKRAAAKQSAPAKKASTTASTVGLPPHLSSTFSPQAGTSTGYDSYAPSQTSAPDWLPGVQSEPVGWQQPAHQAPTPSPGPVPQQPYAQPQQQPYAQPQQQPYSQQQPQVQPQSQWSAPQPSWSAPEPQRSAPEAPSGASFPPAPPAPPVQPLGAPSWIPLPTPSSVIEPSNSVRVRKREFGEIEEDEGTRIASLPTAGSSSRPGDVGWYVRLDDGREVDLTVTVLLGRNPQRSADDPEEVHLVPASGDGRMISRTHVLIGTDPRGVYVVDRGSTNGTALVTDGGELDPAPEGTQVRVREGQQVSYGNRWFTVLRRPEKVG